MLCKRCGAIVPDGIQYCQGCGNDMFEQSEATVCADDEPTVVAEAPVQPPEYTSPTSLDYSQTAYAPPGYTAPVTPPLPPKKNTGLFIGLAAVSIVAVAAIVIAILFGTGVLGADKKDDDPTKETVTQRVEESTKPVNPEKTTKEATTEAPTVALDKDELAINAAISSYYIAAKNLDGTRFKRTASAYINEYLVDWYSDLDLTDPATTKALKEYGLDINSKTLPYDFGAFCVLDDLGDVNSISDIIINKTDISYPELDEQEISGLPLEFAQLFGINFQNPPEISNIAEATATLTLSYNDGTTSVVTKEFSMLKENGEWKVMPA